ncbi:MAG TPA: 16S rRNA (uracil(1498)-N(3))-methyltransferase [Thermoanaerobacterales bacterium]|nr:16S rRNA (uracil(1498)-N(3))-methyltransferase [Thermoanaerobacterales bacterium]
MPRFFVFREFSLNEEFIMSGEDAHHIIKVLRHRTGDTIKLSNGKNIESIGVILDVNPKATEIKLKILEKNIVQGTKPIISLFQGLPKKDKFEWIIQKNTEIGVSSITPVLTKRTIVDIDKAKINRRKERWCKIAKEAAKQCMRMDIPEIAHVTTFESSLKMIKNNQLSIIPWEQEKGVPLKKVIMDLPRGITTIAVYIGPEGGFTEEEVENAKKEGAIPVSLGPRILRTETAGLVTCSLIMYELGNLGG